MISLLHVKEEQAQEKDLRSSMGMNSRYQQRKPNAMLRVHVVSVEPNKNES